MRIALTAFALLTALSGVVRAGDVAGPLTGPVEDRSRICMMQDSMQAKPGLAHAFQGKTYWLCCEMCVQSFQADPERFAHAKDPVNGTLVDKATAPAYAVNGKAFFFSSAETRKTFANNPERYLHGG